MAPPKRPWFRMYVEAFSDLKLRRVKPEHRWLFAACMGAARQSPIPGRLMLTADEPMTVDDLAAFVGMASRSVAQGLADLARTGLVAEHEDGGWHVPAFLRRQYESDLSTPRVAKVREATTMQRPNDDDGTPAETEDREQRTEGENPRPEPQAHVLLAPGRPPSLSTEVDDLVMALVDAHGPDKVDRAVQQLVDDRRKFQWPSDCRKALEAILGDPPAAAQPNVLDDAQRAQMAMAERGLDTVRAVLNDPAIEQDPEERRRILAEQRAARGAA